MPILKALCTVETKARFRALAMNKGLTESMLLRHMVAAVIVQCGEPGAPLPRSETRGGRMGYGGQIKLRLRHAEVHAIRALAEPEGHSAQTWIVQQLRGSAQTAPNRPGAVRGERRFSDCPEYVWAELPLIAARAGSPDSHPKHT